MHPINEYTLDIFKDNFKLYKISFVSWVVAWLNLGINYRRMFKVLFSPSENYRAWIGRKRTLGYRCSHSKAIPVKRNIS